MTNSKSPTKQFCKHCDKRILARGYCNLHYKRWYKYGNALTTKYQRGDAEARFWYYVNKEGPVPDGFSTPCWLWTGCRDRRGYGKFTADGSSHPAHNWLWVHEHGPLPRAMEPDHLCPNKHCVRHLELVTHAENLRRHYERSDKKSHCPQGHEFTPGNTYIAPQGDRQCRTCRKMHQAHWRSEQRRKR